MILLLERSTPIILLAPMLALMIAAPLHAEDKIVGRIRDVHGDVAHACFYRDAMPRAGEDLTLERRVAGTHPKGETSIRSERVGIVRIGALGPDHCAAAQVISGSAREADWVIRLPARPM